MTINMKDTLTLDDDKDYVVVSKINYYYLIDKKNPGNVKFCYESDGDLVEIEDKELNTKLLPYFIENAQKEIKKEFE